MSDYATRYQQLNRSFRPVMVYHLGIDAGFFAEYTYMLHAMLYCLQHGIQFRLYSADANFGVDKGWSDYFLPFCEEDTAAFHHRYNKHAIPSFRTLRRRYPQRSPWGLLKWAAKVKMQRRMGHLLGYVRYHRRIRLNQDYRFDFHAPIVCPALSLTGPYPEAFRRMVDLTWHLNDAVAHEARQLAATLHLPEHYIGCQVRGGDKATEVSLTTPDEVVDAVRRQPRHEDVFVLTDDYRLFEALCRRHPDIHWHTLCTPEERGYVNSAFTATAPTAKRQQMVRFLTSIQLLLQADHFVGSITTGPSLFLLKYLYPHATAHDCAAADLAEAVTLPIADRGALAARHRGGPFSKG
jgi:hypothetical protein